MTFKLAPFGATVVQTIAPIVVDWPGFFKQSFFPASNQNAHSRRERNAQHFAGIDPVLIVDADNRGLFV